MLSEQAEPHPTTHLSGVLTNSMMTDIAEQTPQVTCQQSVSLASAVFKMQLSQGGVKRTTD